MKLDQLCEDTAILSVFTNKNVNKLNKKPKKKKKSVYGNAFMPFRVGTGDNDAADSGGGDSGGDGGGGGD